MPYIKPELRLELNDKNPWSPGTLNFVLTRAALQYIEDKGLSYDYGVNAVIGALECCKLEFYRRLAAPYEDRKIEENGDVYE